MLAYHPAFDASHCAYRFLHVLFLSNSDSIEWDRLRFIDFYYLFPHLLKVIKPLPRELVKSKKFFNKIKDPYENIPNPKRLMFDLRDIQNSTIASLIAKQLICKEDFLLGNVALIKENLPSSLVSNFDANPISQVDWFKVLFQEMPLIEFSGSKGLKCRTGMMEYRYDQ